MFGLAFYYGSGAALLCGSRPAVFLYFYKRRELLYRAAYNMLFSALHYAYGCGIMNLRGIDNSRNA